MRLLDFLFPPRSDELLVRDLSSEGFLARMAPQLVSISRPDTITLLSFSDQSIRAVLHEAKYHGSTRAFDLLALALAEYLRDADEVGRQKDVVRLVPVPLGPIRQRERGFNQVGEVVRRVSRDLGLTLEETLLRRTRETVSQVSLPREKREENARGVFDAEYPADPSLTYVLIDDVATTGATLQAAINALVRAGATHIIPLALAH